MRNSRLKRQELAGTQGATSGIASTAASSAQESSGEWVSVLAPPPELPHDDRKRYAEILRSIAESRRQSAARHPEGSFARESELESMQACLAGAERLDAVLLAESDDDDSGPTCESCNEPATRITSDDVDMCEDCYQVLCDEQGVTGGQIETVSDSAQRSERLASERSAKDKDSTS